jgi:alpha-N-acetylglucosaminidase
MKKILIALLLAALPSALCAGEFSGVSSLVVRRVPWLLGHVHFGKLEGAGADAFELRPDGTTVTIAASGPNAAAAGLGWYLKYYCHRSMSHVGDNLGPVGALPVLPGPVRIESWAKIRYALNYCTFNYTMSFYSWKDWEHELDWMALSGVNLMLVANGEEAVWQNTLKRLDFSADEIERFIPGPGYTAWWLMGNVEGLGGPMSQEMIRRRATTQGMLIERMRSLGIEPLMPGFYGMVPAALKGKLKKAHIVDQGPWAVFTRPAILDPTDPEFARVAGIYYEEMRKLYGPDLHFFSGDPFHEGGIMEGVDLGRAGAGIQSVMQANFPGSTWVLQGWIDNPRRELLAKTDRSHVLVQELFGEKTHNWETRRGYEGTPFVWCCIDNFGERPELNGGLQHYSDEVFRAHTGEFGRYLQGTGVMPEGIDNNPVAYDMALELAWHGDHVDAGRWVDGYAAYRYGRADPDISQAWALLLKTAYGPFEGGSEIVLCARPEMPPAHVTHWGSLNVSYDPAVFARAVELFARASDRFKDSETYRLDLVSFRRQALSNEALGVSREISDAIAKRNRPAFEDAAARFLRLGGAADELLNSEPINRLGAYKAQALAYGKTEAEKQECMANAMALVTYWAGSDRNDDKLHDYAYKAWGGMMDSFDMGRWRAYLDHVRATWDGANAPAPDFFAWERQWARENAGVGASGMP